MITNDIINHPVFFQRNRVARVYTGGKLFSDFFGDAPEDSFFPEEWVCSCIKAINEGQTNPNEGVSTVYGTDLLFTDLIARYPREMLGNRSETGVLVKLLDSSIRLPVQCHPDKSFSEKHFASRHGKAESWLVLATRDDACIYYGFKERVSREDFEKAVDAAENDRSVMPSLLNRISVKPGDVFFIGARMIHAIGAGCLILEVQEPSDFTIQPERYCGDYKLSDNQMYVGLTRDIALDCFNYDVLGDEALRCGIRKPSLLRDTGSVKEEVLISYDDTPCFCVKRVTLRDGEISGTECVAAYVVTDGEGCIVMADGEIKLKKGDYFFAPESIRGKFSIKGEALQFVICLPPKAEQE